jgi:hypothetical protein
VPQRSGGLVTHAVQPPPRPGRHRFVLGLPAAGQQTVAFEAIQRLVQGAMRGQRPTAIIVELTGDTETVELRLTVADPPKPDLEHGFLNRKQYTGPASWHALNLAPQPHLR